MKQLSRREFLRTATAGLTASLAAARTGAAAPRLVRPSSAVDRVMLGNSGVEAPFLAFGTGVSGYNNQSRLTRMGEERALELLTYAQERGLTWLDMADTYGTHFLGKQMLKRIPRERSVVLTKLWNGPEPWEHPPGYATREIDRFRRELDTDYLDIVLLHRQISSDWPETSKPLRDELSELKEKGVIRALGASNHDFGAMEVAASEPWVDILLARVNHMCGSEFSCDNTVEEVSRVLRTAKENGKGVIGMKIFGVGRLTADDERTASLRYVIDNNLIDAMTIGMLAENEVDDNLQRIGAVLQS